MSVVTNENCISLRDALSFIVDNRGRSAPLSDSGYALIATNCVSNDHLYPSKKNIRFVSSETYENWFRAHPKPGDILLTNKGSQNGAICLVPDPVDFCIAQDMMALRADIHKIDPLFLFCALRSPSVQHQIKQLNVDGVIPHFKKTDFNKLFIPHPPPNAQKKIGNFYFMMSSKIELNRQMNKTLEEMAQAIFKSWFVDFDPVKAKAAAKAAGKSPADIERAAMAAIAGKPLAGLDALSDSQRQSLAGTAALFPDSLVDSELGPIPNGWDAGSLADVIKLIGGGTPKKANPEFWDGTIPWFSVKDVPKDGNVYILDTTERITDLGLKKSSAKVLQEGTTIITARGTVGKLGLVGIPMAMNQSCYGIIGKGFPDIFTYFNCKTAIDKLRKNAHGAVFATITRKTFRAIKQVIPHSKVAQTYEAVVHPLLEQMKENGIHSNTLTQLRDTLLPKLLSGEISVTEAEDQVQGAGSE